MKNDQTNQSVTGNPKATKVSPPVHGSVRPNFQPLRKVRCLVCGCENFLNTSTPTTGGVTHWCARCEDITNQCVT